LLLVTAALTSQLIFAMSWSLGAQAHQGETIACCIHPRDWTAGESPAKAVELGDEEVSQTIASSAEGRALKRNEERGRMVTTTASRNKWALLIALAVGVLGGVARPFGAAHLARNIIQCLQSDGAVELGTRELPGVDA
jgi:hypothetical protein